MTTQVLSDRARQDADPDDHRRFIERIDKTIIALLCERMRLDEALGRMNDEAGALEDRHEPRR